MVNTDNSGFNINLNAGKLYKNSPTIPKKQVKNFEEVRRKEEAPSKRRDDAKKLAESEDAEVKAKEAFDGVMSEDGVDAASTKEASSIFDLKTPKEEKLVTDPIVEEDEIIGTGLSDELKKESLSALFQELGTKEKLKSLQKQVESEPSELPVIREEKPKIAAEFSREQPDLSGINPLASNQNLTSSAPAQISTPDRTKAAELQEIVDQIVSKLYILKVDGKTDTTISLKHPPMFAGANLVITAFDSAKGEFNITFENLTQEAKRLLDLGANQGQMRNALEQKGYVVHIITTTTTQEARLDVQGGEASRNKRDEEREGGQKKRDQDESES